jgi:REP element-mobilizing transposase RayT
MSQPRLIVPGATYFITRRCCQRTLRLRPSALTNQIVSYCLALALEKTGVVLHAACFMSNHHHLVVTDARGVLPDFLRELHRSMAKAMNASQGGWEHFWSAEPCNLVRLVDEHDVIDKIAYVAANPVAAGLVSRPEDWPGVSLWTEREVPVARPGIYFDAHGASPTTLVLRGTRLGCGTAGDEGAKRWRRLVQAALMNKVAEAHRNMRAACRGFLGRDGVLAKSFLHRAKTFEPRRVAIPIVAAKDLAARRAVLALHRAFRRAYHSALRVWRTGVRDVVFPFGTWWMRVHHAAACAPPALVT